MFHVEKQAFDPLLKLVAELKSSEMCSRSYNLELCETVASDHRPDGCVC